jgi:hypothetical protein
VRYRVGEDEIRSENTAKPVSQAAAPLVDWLRSRGSLRRALDYGCGKLRYACTLAENSKFLTLVDSAYQLNRTQVIDGGRTNVRAYARKHWQHVRVLDVGDFEDDNARFDFALCANVLSAIPSKSVRCHALGLIRSKLAGDGRALFAVQFRNSFYRDLAQRCDVVPHLDGYVLRTLRGTFYYGLIPPDKLQRIVHAAGFRIENTWISGESAFVLAS